MDYGSSGGVSVGRAPSNAAFPAGPTSARGEQMALAYDRLNANLHELQDRALNLNESLRPVLRPQPPEAATGRPPYPSDTPLIQKLNELNDIAEQVLTVMRDTQSRLKL